MKHLFISTRLLCSLMLSMFLFLGATPMWGTDYELVTSASQLVAGCNYIIADGTSGSVNVISTASNTNNRRTTTATVSNNKISGADAIMVFTLGGSTNAWTLTTTNYLGTNGYLYNNNTSDNRLFVGNNTTYNKFTISFSNNEISSISCNGNTSKGVMCFNGTLVACYASKSNSYKVPQLYKEVSTSSEPCTVTFDAGDYGTCSTSSLTEASAGAGVTLPGVDANDGWHFEGWSKDETPTSANAGAADATFYPTQNCTVYAYYKVIPVTPTFSRNTGTVEKGSTVELSCATDGATIKYTTDGSNPTSSSSTYSSAITLNAAQTIKAIAIKDGVSSEVASASYTIATHTAQFSINGSISDANNCTVAKGEAITFPSVSKVDGVEFMGWKKGEGISGTQETAPTMVNKTTETMGTDNVTYYAVFAVAEEGGAETLTKITAVSQMTAGTYALIKDDSYYLKSVESTAAQAVTAVTKTDGVISVTADMKWVVTGDNTNGFVFTTPGKDSEGKAMYLWGSATNNGVRIQNSLSGSNAQKTWFVESDNNYGIILYNLSETGKHRWLCVYVNSNIDQDWRNYNTVKASQYPANIYKIGGGTSYSDYCTTVSLDPQPTIILGATTLTEYAGNTNNSISVSVSEQAYTGTLEASSDKVAVATASISDGKVVINALTAGTANITITAPAITGFRKNTATIAVTISEKLAHGLAFDAEVLNLTVGQTEITEPTLSNPNSLPVVYSLVYATPANEGKVATINSETGKITLAGLSTETQGDVTVKASTVGDNSHAAGEVTYNLVVARKVTTTSWSNEGAAVNIDKDEIATLPTATNDGNRNIAYESSDEGVAKFVEGVLTFVDYGTTTITAKTSATAEYAATSATYELTFAPRYTVTFNVNGAETVLREETSGAGVTAPAVEPIEGKVFRGWAEDEIEGVTDIAPTFVTTTSLDEDKTLYAVFADMTPGAEGSVEFNLTSITDISNSNAERTQTTDDITFTFSSVSKTNVSGTQYVQMAKSSTLTQNDAFAANIKSITFEGFGYSSTSDASMLVEGKKGNGEYATVQSCGSSYTGAEISFGSNEYDFFKITVGSERTVKFTKMTVSYSGITYSDYCTTVKTTPTLSFANPTYNATMEEDFDAPELNNPQEVKVTYSSSAEGVATINEETGAITLVGPGTTTITATFAGNKTYNATSASYELVVAPAPTYTAQTLTLAAYTNINSDTYYFATFSNSAVTFFPGSGEGYNAEIQTANIENDALSLNTISTGTATIEGNEVEGYFVPANTGILVKVAFNKEEKTIPYYTVTNKEVAALENNLLKPGTGDLTTGDNCKFYRLAYYDYAAKTGLGFYYGQGKDNGQAFTCKAGSAYLAVPAGEKAPARFVIGSTEVTTDLENVNANVNVNKVLINGQVFILRGEKLYDTVGRLVK